MLVRAYVDDSGSNARSHAYFLAGLVAPLSSWEDFAPEWRRILDQEPRIVTLKTSHAMSLDSAFREGGWTGPLRDQRILELAEVATKYAKARVASALRQDDFRRFVIPATPIPEFRDPYFLCFYALVIRMSRQLPAIFGHDVECDLIFDTHGDIGIRAASWWHLVVELLDQKGRNIFSAPPSFQTEERFSPLQAADLYAWFARRITIDDARPHFERTV